MSWFVRIIFACAAVFCLSRGVVFHDLGQEISNAWLISSSACGVAFLHEWISARQRAENAIIRAALGEKVGAIRTVARDLAEIGGIVARASRASADLADSLA